MRNVVQANAVASKVPFGRRLEYRKCNVYSLGESTASVLSTYWSQWCSSAAILKGLGRVVNIAAFLQLRQNAWLCTAFIQEHDIAHENPSSMYHHRSMWSRPEQEVLLSSSSSQWSLPKPSKLGKIVTEFSPPKQKSAQMMKLMSLNAYPRRNHDSSWSCWGGRS